MFRMPMLAAVLRNFLQYRWFFLAMTVYLVSLLVFGFIHHRETRAQVLAQLDRRLLDGAHSLGHLLGPDFHDRFSRPEHMNARQDLDWVLKVTALNRDLGLDFLYAMVERDGRIFFTAANATDEELRNQTYQAFFRPYHEAGPAVLTALRSDRPQYVETRDGWGHFRTVLVPRTTTAGRPYLLAADISIDQISADMQSCLRETIILAALLLTTTLPLLLLYAWPLQQRLYIHPITGLPNRNRLDLDLGRFPAPQITLINIDEFHRINDFFGTDHGNRFLIQVAHRIQGLLGPKDRLYKLGADEYVVLRELRPDLVPIGTLIHQLNRQQIDLADTRIPLAVTAGVAEGATHYLEHADLALKQARQQNQEVATYHEDLHATHDFKTNLAWTRTLMEAIDDGRIIAWFQPIHDNLWNEIVHYEALVRLIDRDGNVIGPAQFLSVARRSRLLGRLSLIMLEQAIAQAKATGHCYSVNLTVENLTDPESSAAILSLLKDSPVAKQIVLEIVESEGIENLEKVQSFIHQAKQLGAAIAIDDFGTGYSNFKHLLELPVDYIKIDGSLIQQITESTTARAVVSAIVTFANQLDAKVVAEYVSNPTVQEAVVNLKIHLSQGYLFGPPVPAPSPGRQTDLICPVAEPLSAQPLT